MKKILYVTYLAAGYQTGFGQGYQVTLNTPSYKAGLAYFTYHMGKNQNIVDSAIIMPNGTAVLGKE